MRNVLAVLSVLLLALGLFACEGGSRRGDPPPRHPDPPPRHPDAQSAPPRADASRNGGRFARPPANADDGRPAELESALPEAAPAPAAPPARSWGGVGREEKSAAGAERSTDEAAAATPGAAEQSRGAPLTPEPRRDRPGLATHWGETRYSPAREVSFEREDSSVPTAHAELHYDDRRGARRLSARGRSCPSEVTLIGGALRVRMLDASGRAFPALCEGGRVLSMGEPGERYSLSIENRTGQRFEVVATVDGLDVLDGDDGSPDKRGYLLGAHSSLSIDGFRRSEEEVAAFRLGDVAHSYAASQGKARNVGVIGCAVFAERPARVYYPRTPVRPWQEDTWLRDTADPFPGRYARPPAW